MIEVENVYKSADLVKDNGKSLTISELDPVQLVLQESGEVIEGIVVKLLTKSIELKVQGEVGSRKFNYKDNIEDIKMLRGV